MLVFPFHKFMNAESCYDFLAELFHPNGLHCPCGEELPFNQCPHKYRKNNLKCYKCRICKKVYNLFTETIFSGIHYDCTTIVLMLQGFAQGKTTSHLSKELEISYNNLLLWRHKLQEFAFENRNWSVLPDTIVESDEVFINAGEKGEKHEHPQDPPRVRANKKKA